MPTRTNGRPVRMFATCPPSNRGEPTDYLRRVIETARWSEAAGCEGILIYTDNGLLDPWLVAQIVVQQTRRLCPLVAVQPAYMHPYAVAKMVTSIGFLTGRRVYLNMVAGGFRTDLAALNDPTPHDERYARLIEYTLLVMALIESRQAITRRGRHYGVSNLKLTPPLAADLVPGVLVSGSSAAGLQAARALWATAVHYPRPVGEYAAGTPLGTADAGIRIGVIARETGDAAWTAARARFPEDRRGQLTHQLAMKVSDSVWHQQPADLGSAGAGSGGAERGASPYWLVPFENYQTFCPYLVGSYDRVGDELARYIAIGYRTFILDVPADPDDLGHIRMAFERAVALAP